MTRNVGRIVVGFALALAFIWTFIALDEGVGSLWEVAARYDILAAVLLLAGIGATVAAFFVSFGETLDRVACVIAGGSASMIVFFALESQWSDPLRVLFACFIAASAMIGAALLSLSAVGQERLSAVLAGARGGAANRAAASQQRQEAEPESIDSPDADAAVPPGWYPDPSAQYTTRYWDGSTWTEQVQ